MAYIICQIIISIILYGLPSLDEGLHPGYNNNGGFDKYYFVCTVPLLCGLWGCVKSVRPVGYQMVAPYSVVG